MEKMKTIQILISDLYEKIDEVSVDTIAPRISEEKLWNWCGAWKQDARAIYGGKLITDLWWIDCADGYVFGLETKGEDNERD